MEEGVMGSRGTQVLSGLTFFMWHWLLDELLLLLFVVGVIDGYCCWSAKSANSSAHSSAWYLYKTVWHLKLITKLKHEHFQHLL